MSTDRIPLIVNDGTCAFCAVHTKQVHHYDFPEIWTEAGSVREAVEHLVNQLSRARDAAACPEHRETIERAMAEVSRGLELLEQADTELESACLCGVRGPDVAVGSEVDSSLAR
jgi:hypothetical protein